MMKYLNQVVRLIRLMKYWNIAQKCVWLFTYIDHALMMDKSLPGVCQHKPENGYSLSLSGKGYILKHVFHKNIFSFYVILKLDFVYIINQMLNFNVSFIYLIISSANLTLFKI